MSVGKLLVLLVATAATCSAAERRYKFDYPQPPFTPQFPFLVPPLALGKRSSVAGPDADAAQYYDALMHMHWKRKAWYDWPPSAHRAAGSDDDFGDRAAFYDTSVQRRPNWISQILRQAKRGLPPGAMASMAAQRLHGKRFHLPPLAQHHKLAKLLKHE